MQQSNQELATPADSDYHHHPHCHVLHGAGASSNLFTPASSTDSEGRVSLPSSASSVKTFLFSPMELSLSGNISAGSLQLASFITPKCKLSMDLDESTQDASDSGYSRGTSTLSSCSSQESCLSFSAALDRVIKQELSTTCTRAPLGDLTNSVVGRRRNNIIHTQKAKRSISFPNEQDKSKRTLSSENQDPYPQCSHTRVSSLPSLPPLPYSPLTQDCSRSRKNSLLQISSPLERMTLLSPGVPTGSQNTAPFTFPSHPAREHSVESDGYSEVFDGEGTTASLPSGLTTLMHAPFTSTSADTSRKEVPISRCKPPVHSTPVAQPGSSPTRSLLACTDSWSRAITHKRRGSLKRASPCPDSSQQPKRKRPPLPVFDSKSQDTPNRVSPLKGAQLLRSQSCFLGGTSEHINMFPFSPGSDNREMIGDHTKTYALPLLKNSAVTDLKCISPQTLAELVKDKYSGAVDEYTIVDCRYPYEYEGGHIQGAQNIWNKDTLRKRFFSKLDNVPESKRRIIVFHCEFSSKRGPDMSRFMRESDRKENGMAFPKLYFPELYLLEGGYKAFYEKFPELCEPNCYVKMLDDRHKEELRHFKHRSKSWTGGDAATSKRRGNSLRPRRSTVDSHTNTLKS